MPRSGSFILGIKSKSQGLKQTPVAPVTVYSAPDDGCKGCPKHVQHTCNC